MAVDDMHCCATYVTFRSTATEQNGRRQAHSRPCACSCTAGRCCCQECTRQQHPEGRGSAERWRYIWRAGAAGESCCQSMVCVIHQGSNAVSGSCKACYAHSSNGMCNTSPLHSFVLLLPLLRCCCMLQGAQHNPAFIVVRSQQLLAVAVSAQQLAHAMLKLPVSAASSTGT